MESKPLFICFSGIDGSGKTTCANVILQDLLQSGLHAKYVWLNPKPIFLFPLRFLVHKTALQGEDMMENYLSYHEKRQKYTSRSGFLRNLYYAIMLFDYLIWVYWNVFSFYFRGVSIVCDRYIYDLVVNLGEILNYSMEKNVRLVRCLSQLMPKPDVVIICDIDEEVAYQRKSDTPHLSYLTAHRPVYRRIAEEFRFPVVDTSQPVEFVNQRVRQIVDAYLES